jgi:hypothetical protein
MNPQQQALAQAPNEGVQKWDDLSADEKMKFRYSVDESFDIGCDSASPVSEEYKAHAQSTVGNIEKVIINLAGERQIDHEAQSRVIMKRQ